MRVRSKPGIVPAMRYGCLSNDRRTAQRQLGASYIVAGSVASRAANLLHTLVLHGVHLFGVVNLPRRNQ